MANGDWRNKNFLEGSASALPKNFSAHQEMRSPVFLNHEQPICTHARLNARGFTACPIPVTIAQLPK
ncbi:MAG: hypothetical protein OGMRLDGQ_001534, partial [Candidatus Fervidibacter sp.]